ncbi:MAG: 16S rRNA (cytosine(967)-C(5))-methyltransferase, partial [Gammaproteobacteria bacterium]|nr:16S rRNA (cytosine(967)-C(5))-methyltransferase [Gammaproteobacteria bacterium]
MPEKINSRAAAARLSWQIIDKGQSLDSVVGDYFVSHQMTPQDRGLVQELVYGVCRWYGELDSVATSLLSRPIRRKDRVVHFLLLVGLYQLRHLRTAEHAAVAETVAACRQLNKLWAKNLLNGCLRSYLREQDRAALE